jgi:hypothetical protein
VVDAESPTGGVHFAITGGSLPHGSELVEGLSGEISPVGALAEASTHLDWQ